MILAGVLSNKGQTTPFKAVPMYDIGVYLVPTNILIPFILSQIPSVHGIPSMVSTALIYVSTLVPHWCASVSCLYFITQYTYTVHSLMLIARV